MAQQIINVVDAGALLHLAQSDNLHLLFADGRKAVVTIAALNEVVTKNPSHPNSIKIQA